MPEPSILDYLKSLFDPNLEIDLNKYLPIQNIKPRDPINTGDKKDKPNTILYFSAVLSILAGQVLLEKKIDALLIPVILYLTGGFLIWKSNTPKTTASHIEDPHTYPIPTPKTPLFIAAIVLEILAFALFGNHTFTYVNTTLWLAGNVLFFFAFWKKKNKINHRNVGKKKFFFILFSISIAIVIFFRVYQVGEVPGEMYSDHAEKLLDVMDVVNGRFPVFFERNTGREAIQFYVTAAIVSLFDTGFKFLSLKIGTIAFGLLTLPFIYLIGKELANPWAGLLAFLFAGIAYWPNVISRVALRYALYPLFAAPAFYFIVKALREKDTNCFLLGGLSVGLGLHGYSAFRIVPLLVILIFTLFYFDKPTKARGSFALSGLTLTGLGALFIFNPLLRYWLDNPGMFSYRALSRLSSVEAAIDQSPLMIFLDNLWDSLVMPFFDNGEIWVHSIPHRPALDVVSAVLFFIGLVAVVRSKNKFAKWEKSSLLLSIPVLMLPSIMSIAFPGENPSLNRSAAAYVPIFVIVGIGGYSVFERLIGASKKKLTWILSISVIASALSFSIISNYQLVFAEYKQQFLEKAWNTSELGEEIAKFIDQGGSLENAFVVPYPHWVDTRLVGFTAEIPGKDFAQWREDITLKEFSEEGDLLFIYKPQDQETEDLLINLFPDGQSSIFYSKIPGKEFMIYTVDN